MAEAHGAVTGSSKVSDEGFDINQSRRTLSRVKNSVKIRVYPFRLPSWLLLTLVICSAVNVES